MSLKLQHHDSRIIIHLREMVTYWTLCSIRFSAGILSGILNSGHLQILFNILDHDKNLLKKFTAWERFRRFASDSISPKIETNSREEAEKVACNFTASIASACRLSTNKVTLSGLNNDLLGLYHSLKHKKRLRKLWHETRDAACKTAVNWAA
jgi:hypothetical protein